MRLNIISSLKAITLLGAFAMVGSDAFAQQAGAANPAPPQGVLGSNVQPMKIAIIDFAALRVGIGELKARYDKLEAEFAPRQQQLISLQNKINAQEKTLQENKTLTPEQARKLAEDIETGKNEFKRTLEDARTTAQRREVQETEAVFPKVLTALSQYCTRNNITHLFDGRKLSETSFLVYASPSANITDGFIDEYNKANPAAGGAAAASKPATK